MLIFGVLLIFGNGLMNKRVYNTISGVSPTFWKIAKASAALHGESLGDWLEIAILIYAQYRGGIDVTVFGPEVHKGIKLTEDELKEIRKSEKNR